VPPTSIPEHLAAADIDAALLDELVAANRILYHRGIVDGFGHVSLRHPRRPDQFLIARSMAPGQVTAADITLLDQNAAPVGSQPGKPYLERFIHAAIYRLRADVMGVVHHHALGSLPLGVVPGHSLRPICHMCGFLTGPAPIFEIRDAAGDGSDMLIRDLPLGQALAEKLGDQAVVLMRGHGATVVGPSLKAAVYRSVYAEVNAGLQLAALRLGEPVYLSEAEAIAAYRTNSAQIDRAWQLWLDEIGQ
jgi:HCOMODA/2-hydroxy-3-carboxy-muconic semialdehyde decarboxylase